MSVPGGNSRCNEEDLRDLLARQHGLVTSAQAGELGLTASALAKRVRFGSLERVLPRIYRSTLVADGVRQRALAAALWAGRDAVVSHATAAELLAIDGLRSSAMELWIPSTQAPRSPRVVVHRGTVDATDRRMRDGIPVTSAARTVIDLAGRLDSEMLEAVVEDVLHRGLTTPAMLERRLEALGGKGRAGAGRLRRVLATRDGAPLESRLEVKVWRLLRDIRPRPVRQFAVAVGGRKYRLDFAWPALHVAVEADGFSAHGYRRAFVADRRRLADLVGAGWTVIPVTWEDCMRDPDGLAWRINTVLLRAA
jgi:very-short-patch-repair endonuclease